MQLGRYFAYVTVRIHGMCEVCFQTTPDMISRMVAAALSATDIYANLKGVNHEQHQQYQLVNDVRNATYAASRSFENDGELVFET